VKLANDGVITEFVEKPQHFVSDLAIIGIYYFKDGENLKKELQYLLDHEIKDKGEYQLTSALENMKNKGMKIKAGEVVEWLDCGNKDATVHTNQRVLEMRKHVQSNEVVLKDSLVIEPCYIGRNVHIAQSVIGPHVSIGDNSVVRNSVISNSIIQNHTQIEGRVIANSMIGNHVHLKAKSEDVSIGDFTTVQ
jgi:glucose-1-phosphate thymidylyltransferase